MPRVAIQTWDDILMQKTQRKHKGKTIGTTTTIKMTCENMTRAWRVQLKMQEKEGEANVMLTEWIALQFSQGTDQCASQSGNTSYLAGLVSVGKSTVVLFIVIHGKREGETTVLKRLLYKAWLERACAVQALGTALRHVWGGSWQLASCDCTAIQICLC